MTEKEKSLKLAELMGWKLVTIFGDADWNIVREPALLNNDEFPVLEPYVYGADGLAQFAAILLKFPDVMTFVSYEADTTLKMYNGLELKEPTQSNILDEILRMNGVKID